MKSINQIKAQLEKARAVVRKQTFGTESFEKAMEVVRGLCAELNAQTVDREEFCSVDSGLHRTRLSSGKIIR